RLSDRLALSLRPDRNILIGDFKIQFDEKDWAPRPEEKEGFEPLRPGLLPSPTLTVTYKVAGTDQEKTLRWEGVTVEVLPPEGADVRGELPIEPLPGDSHPGRFPVREVLAGVGLLAL